jgi:hypothetical protein
MVPIHLGTISYGFIAKLLLFLNTFNFLILFLVRGGEAVRDG